MGGETRLQKSITLMLDDLQYSRELNDSVTFNYNPITDCKISQADMNIEERHKLLRLMDRKTLIKIISTNEDSYLIDTSNTEFPLSIDDVDWPLMKLEGPSAIPSFSKLLKRLNVTDERNKAKKHQATISYTEPTLTLEINEFEPREVAKVSYDTDVSQFLGKVFSQPAGKILKNTEIIEGWGVDENLKQFIAKRRLDCILPFIDEAYLPRRLKLKNYTIYLTDNELKNLLEQIRAKYKKHFEDIIDTL